MSWVNDDEWYIPRTFTRELLLNDLPEPALPIAGAFFAITLFAVLIQRRRRQPAEDPTVLTVIEPPRFDRLTVLRNGSPLTAHDLVVTHLNPIAKAVIERRIASRADHEHVACYGGFVSSLLDDPQEGRLTFHIDLRRRCRESHVRPKSKRHSHASHHRLDEGRIDYEIADHSRAHLRASGDSAEEVLGILSTRLTADGELPA